MGIPYTKSTNLSSPRTRRVDKTFKSNYQSVFGPDTSTTTYSSFTAAEWKDNLSGYRNPGWQRRIAEGQDAGSVLTASRTRHSGSSGSLYAAVRKKYDGTHWYEEAVSVPYGLVGIPKPSAFTDYAALQTKAKNAVIAKAVQRARQVQTGFQSGVYLGELRESVRMFTGGVKGIAQGIDRYLTRSGRETARAIRRLPRRLRLPAANSALADQWLMMQYGIKPFVNDVQSAAEALARLEFDSQMEDRVIFKVTSVAKRAQLVDVGTGPAFWNYVDLNNPSVQVRYRLRDDDLVRVTLLVCVEANRTGLGGLAQYMGFTTQDFLPTVYNLIPYSFLLDYFSNCNEVVDAYAFNWSAVKFVWETVKIERTRCIDECVFDRTMFLNAYSAGAGFYGHTTSFTAPTQRWTVSSVSRQPHANYLVPEVEFEIPGAKDWRKWANMSALARNLQVTQRTLFNLLNR